MEPASIPPAWPNACGLIMLRERLQSLLAELLATERYEDYCPNGLQVEGRAEVRRVIGGVSASLALIHEAARRDADAILVHHGWFWRGEDRRLVGPRRQRVAALLAHGLNLFAYHLPLDAHPELGNNAQLARELGWQIDGHTGGHDLVCLGRPVSPGTLAALARDVATGLAREPLVIGESDRPVQRIAWCTGAAQDHFEIAIEAGVDAFLSGEISEQTVHLARESGVGYLAIGHHASERYGVRALCRHLSEQHGLDCEFVDLDNPV